MRTSTRLATFCLLALVSLAACGDDDGGDDDDDVLPDAGADASPLGAWKLAQITDLTAGTITDVDTDVLGTPTRVNGTLLLDGASGRGAYTLVRVADGVYLDGSLEGVAGSFDLADDLSTLNVGGDGFTFMYSPGTPETLLLGKLDGSTYEYRRFAAEDEESIVVSGVARFGPGAITVTNPHVALIALVRGDGGALDFFNVSEGVASADTALAAGGQGPFTLARAEGALGVERIPFPGDANLAVNAVVGYEDRDGNGKLDRFVIDECTDEGMDCIRGVAALGLGYRVGDSAELHASDFGFLRPGWQLAAFVDDAPSKSKTIVPLDPTTVAPKVDLVFSGEPAAEVAFPDLRFGQDP
jgi:hypothetical protein